MGFEGLAERLRPRALELAAETDSQSVYFVEKTWREWLRRAQVDDDVEEAVFAGIGHGAVTAHRSQAPPTGLTDGTLT
jgi:hypothetical protein